MKYSKKIGNDYVTFTEEDFERYAPSSFKEGLIMWFFSVIGIGVLYLIIIGISDLLGMIYP